MMRLSYLLVAGVLGACSSGPSEPTGSSIAGLTGPVEVRVAEDTDNDVDDPAAPDALRPTHVVVTISRVDARIDDASAKNRDDDDWTTLALTTRTVDLLALPAGGFSDLGVTQLPAGGIERLRLFVSAGGPTYVVTADGQSHPLVVPSGEIRVVGDFDAEPCAIGQVTLAFASRASIEVHPLGDDWDGDGALRADASPDAATAGPAQWVLRPVIRVSDAPMDSAPCEDDERVHGHDDDGQHGGDRR
jgi:hypothetical protein